MEEQVLTGQDMAKSHELGAHETLIGTVTSLVL